MSAPAIAPPKDSVQDARNSVEVVRDFVGELSTMLDATVESIDDVNASTQLLSLNARIESARAGQAGAAFSIVAQEMQQLSSRTGEIASEMSRNTRESIDNLLGVIDSSIRGSRLSDMALTNIDLVDRNLYERTCDVRWWATDSSLVDALTSHSQADFDHASHRLGVILDAYTVYHDLVLCDLEGKIVSNGRPQRFGSVGSDVSKSTWFKQASATASGDEYGFETAHCSELVDGKSVLVYSCGVREGGRSDGRLIGVLGILFNWDEFAQAIVEQTPLSESEKQTTRCCICCDDGLILADTSGQQLVGKLGSDILEHFREGSKNHLLTTHAGKPVCLAHAKAPGFETYSTGWHSVIIQDLANQ